MTILEAANALRKYSTNGNVHDKAIIPRSDYKYIDTAIASLEAWKKIRSVIKAEIDSHTAPYGEYEGVEVGTLERILNTIDREVLQEIEK